MNPPTPLIKGGYKRVGWANETSILMTDNRENIAHLIQRLNPENRRVGIAHLTKLLNT